MCCLAPVAATKTPGLCLECLRARQHSIVILFALIFAFGNVLTNLESETLIIILFSTRSYLQNIKTALKHFADLTPF